MKLFRILAIASCTLLFAGCMNSFSLSLPANWKEQNVINLQNTGFTGALDSLSLSIDPSQTWNMAEQITQRTGKITITDYRPGATTKAGLIRKAELPYNPEGAFPQYYFKKDTTVVSSKEDIKSSEEENADFFILKEGNVLPIEFNNMDCWAETTLGVYYYDIDGNIIEQELFSRIIGKKYGEGDAKEIAKTEGVKQLTIEDGTAFGIYMISRTGPDIDKVYKTDVTHKFYSEAALNPDGLSHVKLQTKVTATTTKYRETTQKIKVTRTTVAGKIAECKEGDEGALKITVSGYYKWNGNSIVKSSNFGGTYLTKGKWYHYVPEHYEYTETKDGKATTKEFNVTSEYHTEYLINYEDTYGGGDLDYNDLSLKVNSSIIKGSGRLYAADRDLGPWMILCEDLGTGADNDFNDMIFAVYRTGAETMKIKYLACGATRQDYVLFNSAPLCEMHNIFGVNIDWGQDYGSDNGIPRPGWFVNTRMFQGKACIEESTWSRPIISDTIQVDSTLSMSSFYRHDIENSNEGFSVKSEGMQEVPFSPAYKGYSPFIICVPAKNFRWPMECISIFEAYPEFAGWAEDHTKNVNWYLHPVEDKVVDLDTVLNSLGK